MIKLLVTTTSTWPLFGLEGVGQEVPGGNGGWTVGNGGWTVGNGGGKNTERVSFHFTRTIL